MTPRVEAHFGYSEVRSSGFKCITGKSKGISFDVMLGNCIIYLSVSSPVFCDGVVLTQLDPGLGSTITLVFLHFGDCNFYKFYYRFIKPVENQAVSLAALGEGWHNYHHVFPWDYRTSELGRLNISTKFIDTFAKIGWAYDCKFISCRLILFSWHMVRQTPLFPVVL